MHDDALLAWINSGAKIELTDDEAKARRAGEFSARFLSALSPDEDLGKTEELHEAAVAQRVLAVHLELNALVEEIYSAVWSTLAAPKRAAIKRYISAAAHPVPSR